MYYHHRSDVGGEMVSLGIVLVLLLVWALVRLVAFVIRTLIKHSKHTALRVAGVVCVILCAFGCLLAAWVYVGFLALPVVGIVGFLVTCLGVDLRSRQTLLPEKTNLVNQVLHTSWWSAEDKPLEQATPLAA